MSAQPPELVDNEERYSHADALAWLGEHRPVDASVATGYVRIGGLVALAELPGPAHRRVRLLLGAMPDPGLGAVVPVVGQERALASKAFQATLDRLREERDFDAFPASRRTASLDLVEAFVRSEAVAVRRFTDRFLHGKAYLFAERGADGALAGEGAALITSANLTPSGLEHNLELGAVSYQPNMVELTLRWFDKLWDEADDFKEKLLELLYPPAVQYSPQEIFLRALMELFGPDLEKEQDDGLVSAGLTLTSFQEDGYRRARRILDDRAGVIYADGVGTGKTAIGLRFVEEYAKERGLHTLIVAPAQLRESLWQHAVFQRLLPAEVVSYQELAQDRQLGGTERVLHVDKDAYRLVVVDEAHAYRNSGNTWYAALDRLLGGSRKSVVLLTATPVNNSLWDLYNMVMLFARYDSAFLSDLGIPSLRERFIRAGARDPEQIKEELLFPVVDAVAVRRDRRFIQDNYPGQRFADGTLVSFPEPELHEVRYDLDLVYPGLFKDVVAAIGALKMARYVPARYLSDDGSVDMAQVAREEALAGLMQSQLLKRFESSAAAARATLGRMVMAHEALVVAWDERGEVPSLAKLRAIVQQEAEDTPLPDLVDAALDDDADALPASAFDPRFREDVQADLEELRSLASQLDAALTQRDPKLDALAEVLNGTDADKVAVFCSYADTARYVESALEMDPDRFGGRAFAAVIGTETDPRERMRQLERFTPRSVTGDWEMEPPDDAVDLLLSTDVLSEGQNLQEAQAVVSYDMPWNPQRVVQRNGRIIRLRSPWERVFLYTMLPKQGDLEAALKLEAKVRGKILAANATFGMENQVLAAVEAEQKTYADAAFNDLQDFFRRIQEGDPTLVDEGQGPGSGAFLSERYRLQVLRLLDEGRYENLRRLPWGIGAAFIRPGLPAGAAGVFFGCRTTDSEREWRFVTFGGEIVSEDLAMLRLIDPGDQPGVDLPDPDALERAWVVAAEDIVAKHNALLDPKVRGGDLPLSQRWALDLLRSPDLPSKPEYEAADEALSVGRGHIARRKLSEVRARFKGGAIGPTSAADEIVAVVNELGLRREAIADEPTGRPLTIDDLGVVVFQAVLSP